MKKKECMMIGDYLEAFPAIKEAVPAPPMKPEPSMATASGRRNADRKKLFSATGKELYVKNKRTTPNAAQSLPCRSQVKQKSSIRQFSWLQLIALRRLPMLSHSDVCRMARCYSGGTAPDFHRLPY